MKQVFFALLGAILLSACSTQTIKNPVYLSEGFESGIYAPWEGQYSTGNYSVKIVDTISRQGKYSARFTIGADDYWVSPNNDSKSARSEIQIFNVAPDNTELYYSWSFLIPGDYAESDDWQVIGQFHDQPDSDAGETWANYQGHSPPVAVNYKNQKVQIAVSAPDNVVRIISERQIEKGVWHDIVFHIFWSTSNKGFMEVWLDNIPLSSADGKTTRYYGANEYNKAGNYLKIGLYRSNNIKTENSIYFDEIRSGPTSDTDLK